MTTQEILIQAKKAAQVPALLTEGEKNAALSAMADALETHAGEILSENRLDLDAARGVISSVMLDRLMLNEARIHDMAEGIRDVIKLPDPVGKILSESVTQDGL
ncbi:MAG: gamma-glutamyl-phosphate reductase, partial [Clostridia bacterium]|nr:gamma-glutamyl-phosphate reductase [Clostridia bacterium]